MSLHVHTTYVPITTYIYKYNVQGQRCSYISLYIALTVLPFIPNFGISLKAKSMLN